MTKLITFRAYRTYLLNLAAKNGAPTLAEKVKKADTKELKVWYAAEFMLNEGKTALS